MFLTRTIRRLSTPSLVSTQWLAENSHQVKILDASWHLPKPDVNLPRPQGIVDYEKRHIKVICFQLECFIF